MAKQEQRASNNTLIRDIVATGIGAAIFFILNRCLVIPSGVPNTNITIAYPFLALLGAIFGPIVAGLAGFIGHALTDATWGSIWWTWVISSGVAGVLYGLLKRRLNLSEGKLDSRKSWFFIIAVIVINYGVWALLAPTLDVLVYAEPAARTFTQGVVSATSNALSTAIIGWILLKAYSSTQTRRGSLKKEV